MSADGAEDIGIGMSDYKLSGPACRKTGELGARWIRLVIPSDRAGLTRNHCGFAQVACLVFGTIPVPTFLSIGLSRLRRLSCTQVWLFLDPANPDAP